MQFNNKNVQDSAELHKQVSVWASIAEGVLREMIGVDEIDDRCQSNLGADVQS